MCFAVLNATQVLNATPPLPHWNFRYVIWDSGVPKLGTGEKEISYPELPSPLFADGEYRRSGFYGGLSCSPRRSASGLGWLFNVEPHWLVHFSVRVGSIELLPVWNQNIGMTICKMTTSTSCIEWYYYISYLCFFFFFFFFFFCVCENGPSLARGSHFNCIIRNHTCVCRTEHTRNYTYVENMFCAT